MDDDSGRRWVFGLCADWCGVCKEWRAVFDAAAARRPGDRFVWIDIEDEDDLVGDVDIETFPALLVGVGKRVLFFGPTLPAPELLDRLLSGLDSAAKSTAGLETQALFGRLTAAHL